MMWGYYPGMGWWMVVSSLFWLALVAVAVWALVRFLGHQTRPGTRSQRDDLPNGLSAEEILRQRYARGEIDDATFARIREQLAASASREPALPPKSRQ
jgi:putative membrane protein